MRNKKRIRRVLLAIGMDPDVVAAVRIWYSWSNWHPRKGWMLNVLPKGGMTYYLGRNIDAALEHVAAMAA